ncbi:MAG: hypothetical protein ACXAEX_11325 [Promethearchaeota archaeon]|jgi:hypothetical protein
MSNKLSKIYIGAICNRDLDKFDKIKKFCNKNHNISMVNLLKKGTNTFSAKYLKKQLKKYPISLIIIKLLSQNSNEEIYTTLKEVAPNIPQLNDMDAVKTCESRKDTFKLIKETSKKLFVPRSFNSIRDAYMATRNGTYIVIKRDIHNIPNMPKEDRILGIAKNPDQFRELTEGFKDEELFFQEYLGKFDIIYKVYIVGRWAVSITSHNRLRQKEHLSPLELIHIRVPLDKQLKRRILRLGRKMGMSIYGIDYILSKDGVPYIVDVNDFPSFRSIPEAVSLISDYIYNVVILQQQVYRSPIKIKG